MPLFYHLSPHAVSSIACFGPLLQYSIAVCAIRHRLFRSSANRQVDDVQAMIIVIAYA